MSALETYLSELLDRRNRVKDETGNYDVLLNLLNEVGSKLKPKVKAVGELKNKGADNPDMGFFADKSKDEKPTNGAIEVKKPSVKLDKTLSSDQVVKKYLPFYHVVLVTNYFQFALMTENEDEEPQIEERYSLAENEAEFWELCKNPRKAAEQHEAALKEYLGRAMQRTVPINKPEDVAKILASYAREAKARLVFSGRVDALTNIRKDLENALGITFGENSDDFFESTLVQTLFYGIFSSWVLWHEKQEDLKRRFDLRNDVVDITLPAIQGLFEEIMKPSTIKNLNWRDLLDWTNAMLNRVNRKTFFDAFESSNAIQYFYEPFLKSFDPVLREKFGVWYTPPEIVDYMVERNAPIIGLCWYSNHWKFRMRILANMGLRTFASILWRSFEIFPNQVVNAGFRIFSLSWFLNYGNSITRSLASAAIVPFIQLTKRMKRINSLEPWDSNAIFS